MITPHVCFVPAGCLLKDEASEHKGGGFSETAVGGWWRDSPWKGDSKQCISVKAQLSVAVGCSFCPHNPTPAPALLCSSLNGSSLPSFKFFLWQCHLSLMIAWFLILWNLLPFYRSQLLQQNTKPG